MARSALVLAAITLGPAAAHADLLAAREHRCAVAVRWQGPIATVVETHDLVGANVTPDEATYEFALPADAAIVDARVGDDTAAVAVAAEALATVTPGAADLRLAPDRGLVRWIGGDDVAHHYQARIYPVTSTRPTRLTVTWHAPGRYEQGRMALMVPARGDHDALARCTVTLHAGAGAGIKRFASAFINGQKVAVSGGKAEVANPRALAIELEPQWKGRGPVVASYAQAVGAVRALTSVAVYLPGRGEAGTLAPPRLLLVVDTTRSMGGDGRAGAATIADALLAAVPPATPIEVITFGRDSRRLLGAWTSARDARRDVRKALAGAPLTGGTDLAAALNLASTVAGDEPTRVVVITDAVLSTRLTAADLLGATTMAATLATLDVIIPVVPGAPLPDRSVVAPLAAAFHGKVVTLRTAELAARAPTLARELADGQPLRDLSVTVDGEPLTLELPSELAPGSGVIAHASHAQPLPRAVRLIATRGTASTALDAVALPATTAALATVAAGHGHVARDTAGLDPADLLALSRRTSAITPSAALAIVAPDDAGGAARLELARTTGAFTRTPPAGSLELDLPVTEPAAAPPPIEADHNLPETTYKYLIKYQLWPAVRACYAEALRGHARFEGTLLVTLEVARGEVHDARFGGSPLPSGFVACVAQAAYAIEVPTYALDGLAETIAIVNKPIHLTVPPDEPEPNLDEVLGVPPDDAAAATLE